MYVISHCYDNYGINTGSCYRCIGCANDVLVNIVRPCRFLRKETALETSITCLVRMYGRALSSKIHCCDVHCFVQINKNYQAIRLHFESHGHFVKYLFQSFD